MTQLEAFTKLQNLGHPLFETRDVAALLNVKESNATQIAARLAKAGLLVKLARGKWAMKSLADPFAVAEHLTAPFPSYISLQSALHYHGLISQIPHVTYAVSLARTRRFRTPLGAFSIHHVEPGFFFGYEMDRAGQAKIATPEKALLDIFYFRPTRSRLFVHLPEVEFPTSFNWALTRRMAKDIRSVSRRALVEKALASARTASSTRVARGASIL
jgi:predicted transcriptional regulator of viral defense system